VTPLFAPRFAIRISGVTLAADVADAVSSLTVETDLDLAGTFSVVLHNPDNALLDSALLELGKTVEIHLGYGAQLVPAFLGEIAAIEPSFPPDGPRTITLSGYDKSYRMRHVQRAPCEYDLVNDSLIAAQIAALNGLVPMVDPAPVLPEKVVQVQTDMAFLKSRAARYFFDVYVEWDRLHFQFPRPATSAHVLEWGSNLHSFAPRLSATALAGLQVVRGYNQELAQTIYAAALAADLDVDNLVERLGSSLLGLLSSLVRQGVTTHSVDNPLDAAELARALLAELLEGMYEGSGSCIGLPELTAGGFVEIRGVGRRFGGTFRARKVTHRIDGSGFTTSFVISQRGEGSLLGRLRKEVLEEPSPWRSEPFYGVVVGEVEDNNELGSVPPAAPLGRVKVSFPSIGNAITSTWAPCARPMAGKDSGFYAVPDVGEQVLVAFERGDLTKPYVLGALWSLGKGPPGSNADGRNAVRVLKSRSGHVITFDDSVPGGRLVIEDSAGSRIAFDSSRRSVTITAQGDLTLTAANGATTIAMTASGVDVR
jgi:phage protein D/phage baseplate assembly protein gpV